MESWTEDEQDPNSNPIWERTTAAAAAAADNFWGNLSTENIFRGLCIS